MSAAVAGRGGGPLRAVLAILDAGAPSVAEVAARTGLDREVVAAVVSHLARTGHLRAEYLAVGCPTSGCGSCPSDGRDGKGVGCGSSGPSSSGPSSSGPSSSGPSSSGPSSSRPRSVLVALTRVRPSA